MHRIFREFMLSLLEFLCLALILFDLRVRFSIALVYFKRKGFHAQEFTKTIKIAMATNRNIIALFLLIGILSACGNAPNSDDAVRKKTKVVKEVPQLQTQKIDLGKIRMNQDGNSIGSNTELTELKKQLRNEEHDKIVINWIWDSSPKYDDMPMRLVYNKVEGVLKLIYTKNNVIEEYNKISVECLSDFLKNKEQSFYSLESYCKDSGYDFNNREMTNRAQGKKPDQSELDGSVGIVKEFVRETAHDKSSVDFIEWSKVSPFGEYWVVRCKYSGTNALGGKVTEDQWFYIQDSEVVKTKPVV